MHMWTRVSDTQTLSHMHVLCYCISPSPSHGQLAPARFSLGVLFVLLSWDEHIWRGIYFHPIWKHISPWPWAWQISEERPSCHVVGWEGWGHTRRETKVRKAPWDGLAASAGAAASDGLSDHPHRRTIAEGDSPPSLLPPSNLGCSCFVFCLFVFNKAL